MQYHGSSYAEDVWDVFWYEKNLQGDIVAVYNDAGTKLVTYYYDAFGGVYGCAIESANYKRTYLTNKYYSENKAPEFSTPNTSLNTIRYNDYTGKYERSTSYYDYAGRQVIRIDWTDHGRPDHVNPHVHYRIYTKQKLEGFRIRLD